MRHVASGLCVRSILHCEGNKVPQVAAKKPRDHYDTTAELRACHVSPIFTVHLRLWLSACVQLLLQLATGSLHDVGSLGRMLQIDLPRDWANLALHRDVWRGVVSRC